jgi:hypothetical protein
MSNVARFRRLAVAAFKRHGQLTLDAEGVRAICEALESAVAERGGGGECSDADLQPLLDAIVGACKVLPMRPLSFCKHTGRIACPEAPALQYLPGQYLDLS